MCAPWLRADTQVRHKNIRLIATWCQYIQTQLGQTNPTITLTLYTHLLKPTKQEDACRLEEAVFGKDGSKMGAVIHEPLAHP